MLFVFTFIVGFLIGAIVVYLFIESGVLIIDATDEFSAPYLMVELNRTVDEVKKKRFVLFRVKIAKRK